MDDETYREIEHRYQLAEARFDVADQLGWVTAILMGYIVYLKWDSLLYAFIAFVVMFIVVTYRERKAYNAAEKAWKEADLTQDTYSDNNSLE